MPEDASPLQHMDPANKERAMNKLLIIPLAALLFACTARDEAAYPSLLPKPAEPAPSGDAAPRPKATAPADSENRLQALAALREKAEETFVIALPAVEASIRRAGSAAVGSEAWVDAELALGRLTAAQSPALSLAADIAALRQDLAAAEIAGADVAALIARTDALAADVDKVIANQNETVGRLRAALAG